MSWRSLFLMLATRWDSIAAGVFAASRFVPGPSQRESGWALGATYQSSFASRKSVAFAGFSVNISSAQG